jgi:uncharacterized protein YndB with AHSA1/START domain
MANHPDPIPIDGITIVREFEASIEKVFDAWAEPQRFSVWFGSDKWTADLITVERPNRLVIAFDPADGWRYLTVLLDDEQGRARMTFHQGGGALTPEQLALTKTGWQHAFTALEELLIESQLD